MGIDSLISDETWKSSESAFVLCIISDSGLLIRDELLSMGTD
jgi:hypothetical protein